MEIAQNRRLSVEFFAFFFSENSFRKNGERQVTPKGPHQAQEDWRQKHPKV
jgi:hypothetical protein